MESVLRAFTAIVLALSACGQTSTPVTPDELVHGLREFEAALPGIANSDGRSDSQC